MLSLTRKRNAALPKINSLLDHSSWQVPAKTVTAAKEGHHRIRTGSKAPHVSSQLFEEPGMQTQALG